MQSVAKMLTESTLETPALYENPSRRNQWRLISTICFAEPDIDGCYLTEADYGALYQLAPNIQYAFDIADEAFSAARKTLWQKPDKEKAATQQ